jgi:WD40 repeat protein
MDLQAWTDNSQWTAVDFDPDGEFLALGHSASLLIAEFDSLVVVSEYSLQSDVGLVEWAPGGRLLAVGLDAGLEIVAIDGLNPVSQGTRFETESVHGIRWSSDGAHLAVATHTAQRMLNLGGGDSPGLMESPIPWMVAATVALFYVTFAARLRRQKTRLRKAKVATAKEQVVRERER